MKLGIDFGASYVDVVLVNGRKIVDAASIHSDKYYRGFLDEFVGRRSITSASAIHSRRFREKRFRTIPIVFVDEITAIGRGAELLSRKKKGFVCNIGTGTPFVFFNGHRIRHVGGTGVGGGTLAGLAKLMLDCEVEELEKLAKTAGGDGDSLDLTVSDVVGSSVGLVPANATASNFGKALANPGGREETAKSLLKLVSESVGTSACFAAKSCGCNEIVFTGRVVDKNKFVRERLSQVTALFGCKPIFTTNATYCTALGTLLV